MRAAVRVGEPLGRISPGLFGHNLEHLADCIYPGVWRDGLREDVVEAVAQMRPGVLRWPGGCFADHYHWQDGIGARHQRPVRRNWHWGGTEPNSFGTEEFLQLCRRTGAAAHVTVNLGSGTLHEALRWVDYCNGELDTDDVRQRRAAGRDQPHGVRLWGIGNETWGPWEAGHCRAEQYARTVENWARMLKGFDPLSEVVAVGSSEARDQHWDRLVLDRAGHQIDHLSLHVYGRRSDHWVEDEYLPLVCTPEYVQARIRALGRVLDEHRSGAGIAVDEWNVRHYDARGGLRRESPRTLTDAVFAAGVLNAFVRASPRVSLAEHVVLTNGNAPLQRCGDRLVRTPLFHVFAGYGRWMRGRALSAQVDAPTTAMPEPQVEGPGHVPAQDGLPDRVSYLDASAAGGGQGVSLALVNRHRHEELHVRLELPDGLRPVSAWQLAHPDPDADNAEREQVTPRLRPLSGPYCRLPPHSVTWVRAV
jgi:alpha-N-arabinofuranosidase